MADLSSQYAGATRTESLIRGRTKVAEYYRLQIEQLANERRNLEILLSEIPDHQQKLHQRQQEIEQWLRDRQNELTGLATGVGMSGARVGSSGGSVCETAGGLGQGAQRLSARLRGC